MRLLTAGSLVRAQLEEPTKIRCGFTTPYLGLFLNLCPANARCVKNSCAAVLEEVLVHRRGITNSSMTAASGGGRECENAQKPESQASALRLDETTWFQDGRGRRYRPQLEVTKEHVIRCTLFRYTIKPTRIKRIGFNFYKFAKSIFLFLK